MPQKTLVYRKDYTPSDFLIESIQLDIILDEDVTRVHAKTIFYLNPGRQSTTLVLQGRALRLVSLILDEHVLKPDEYSVTDETLTIKNVPARFLLTVETEIEPQHNASLEGLYRSRSIYCTQCEAEGFRKITYYLDRSDVMAIFTTRIEADERYPILLSNGNCIESGKLPDHRHYATWHDPFKKPCYLFALVAGDLACREDVFVTQSGRKITLKIFVEHGKLERSAYAMEALKKSMRWDEVHYGREYDLAIFMIVAVSDFNMGAMENKGLNLFNDKYILAAPETATDQDYENIDSVVAHEYFHNWTGNRITCRNWFNLCLKEGLTVFRDQSFTEDMVGKSVARIKDVETLRKRQFPEDASPLAHPVRPEQYVEISNFYTSTVYEKGAEIYRMLHTLLGEKKFRAGMDLYFKDYDGQAVTIDEFVAAMEKANAVDLSLFRLWYSEVGTPVIDVKDHYEGQRYTLTVTQMTQKPMLIPMQMALFNQSGKVLKPTQLIKLQKQTEVIHFDAINEKPIPSLFQHFSAPIKLHYDYSDEALAILMQHDTDDVNHWEAGQRWGVRILLRLVDDLAQKKPLQIDKRLLAVFQHLLQDSTRDPALLALSLTLPDETYVASMMPVVAVDHLHTARVFLLEQLGHTLKTLWQARYAKCHREHADYTYSSDEAGRRALQNVCLLYLAYAGEYQLAQKQYQTANNMTDKMGALLAVNSLECEERHHMMVDFFNQYRTDHLVLNKWFSLQAMSRRAGVVATLERLAVHADFDIKNPNKVYALFSVFTADNTIGFHQADGAGYRFVADTVIKLDAFNPLVAARVVKGFSCLKSYDAARQALIKAELKRIQKQPHLSCDVQEIVTQLLQGN